jgi:hypothetical protein
MTVPQRLWLSKWGNAQGGKMLVKLSSKGDGTKGAILMDEPSLAS